MKADEATLETAALDWLADLGYEVVHGGTIAPGEPAAERTAYDQVVLQDRLKNALVTLNPNIPADALDEAFRKVTTPDSPSLIQNNRAFHRMLVDGVPVEYKADDGRIVGDVVRLVDFDDPGNNEFLAVNQFTVKEIGKPRRPDIVLFVNGLPLAVIELKSPTAEEATVWTAYDQLQTYKAEIPTLFATNEALVVSDGYNAFLGSLTAGKNRFMPWRTIEGEELAPKSMWALEVLLRGAFDKRRFLDLIRHFVVFEEDAGQITKKMAGYHQFHAVNRAVEQTVAASAPKGDKRGGVVWHTQGSGKSLTMLFFAGKIVQHSAMENPTLVYLTDRNDLDDQLFGTFALGKDVLRQTPVQANDRDELRKLLQVASGGVIFTTVQKFFPDDDQENHPLLSDRRNIVFVADEAHRSQYGFSAKSKMGKVKYGFAKYMRDALPNATFIGFTGTPVELGDKNTRNVFGDYVSVYDIERAVEDGATVPIYYESRLAKLELDEAEKPHIDEEFEEVTEGEEQEAKEKLKTKWAALEALVGSDNRTRLIARDLVTHWERRLETMAGKAMIVCMSRRICVDLYDALVKLRPDWHGDKDEDGVLKVVMTGSASDPAHWQKHIRNKSQRKELAKRFKDENDKFQIVIVRDMWLTGFDAPCLHTMYLDKPMHGHGFMQAIARVNRVFKDKPGGLVVDYLGLADSLRRAMAAYTEGGGRGETAMDQETAVNVMKEKYEICRSLFHGFSWPTSPKDQFAVLPAAQEHILALEDGKERLIRAVTELSKAFALAVPHDDAIAIRDDVHFFQAVKAALAKQSPRTLRTQEEYDLAIRQIVAQAVSSNEVIDIFAAAGLEKPNISILSGEFLEEVRSLPHKNLAVELLRKLLRDEIKTRSRTNLVQSRSFAEMLEKSIRAYQNRAIEAAQVIEELIELAKQIGDADRRGEDLGLNTAEVAFYDALETNDSAVQVLGDDVLKAIAQELVEKVRGSVTIDWTQKESVRAKLRVLVKRTLKKYGYPPDKQEKATQTVLAQAELLGWEVAA